MNETKPILVMDQVGISYQGKQVVKDFSIRVEQGEILGIVGESGSGKSTVIKAAMGLLEKSSAVTTGSISFLGQDILKEKPEQIRRLRGPKMGMIFQNTADSLCPIRTIEEQLYECVLAHETATKAAVKERALDLFEKMNLKEGERILKSYPFELSGGMNQRVGIMLAMIMQPSLLFADEPTSALDAKAQKQVVVEMMKMRELYGTTIVIVTHNIGVVEAMADKVAVMQQGTLVEYGPTAKVTQNPQSEYTKKLLHSVFRIQRG